MNDDLNDDIEYQSVCIQMATGIYKAIEFVALHNEKSIDHVINSFLAKLINDVQKGMKND